MLKTKNLKRAFVCDFREHDVTKAEKKEKKDFSARIRETTGVM